jgi:hypothetical protein
MSRAYLGLTVALPTPSISATPYLAGGVMLLGTLLQWLQRNSLADARQLRRSHVGNTLLLVDNNINLVLDMKMVK